MSITGCIYPHRSLYFRGPSFFFLFSSLILLPLFSQDAPPGKTAEPNPVETRAALTEKAVETADFISLLGLKPDEIFSLFGSPAEIFPFRGEEAWQDSVVFYYSNQIYIFWYKNRVWQVRADGRYTGKVFSLSMGSTRTEVISAMGIPAGKDTDSLIYRISGIPFPVNARFFFEGDTLTDCYIYRSDF